MVDEMRRLPGQKCGPLFFCPGTLVTFFMQDCYYIGKKKLVRKMYKSNKRSLYRIALLRRPFWYQTFPMRDCKDEEYLSKGGPVQNVPYSGLL